MKKRRVAILFGGRSAEHEISLLSAKNVAAAIDRKKYDVVLIGIDKRGRWLPAARSRVLLGTTESIPPSSGALIPKEKDGLSSSIDVVFPVLHGPFGEDGTVQGLLKLAGIPFVGPSVLGSAVGMDKDVMKRLLRDAKIPIARFATLRAGDTVSYARISRKLGKILFVKPANLGSSVGVNKIQNASQFSRALKEAFRYDTKVIVEEYIRGREIECAVLGNEEPKVSLPGEVIVHHDFYSYDAKYVDEHGASLSIPARIPRHVAKKVQNLSLKAFQSLECEGMGRVDCFVTARGKVYVNEINTIPGFTNISMYPKLWEASGLPYPKLIDRLLSLAIERAKRDSRLSTSR
jgi:D-alanine-D-alanine ligase